MNKIQTKACKLVKTKGFDKKINGSLMEIASSRDKWSKFLDNAQVYLTTLNPRQKKGFHLHKLKTNQVACIKGKVILGIWDRKTIKNYVLDSKKPMMVRIPKMHALAFFNPSRTEEAFIINLCSPPYDPKVPEQEDIDLPWKTK